MSSCIECDAGRYAGARAHECFLCMVGFVAPEAASVSCAACVAGKVAPNAGSQNCTECDTGATNMDIMCCSVASLQYLYSRPHLYSRSFLLATAHFFEFLKPLRFLPFY